MEVNCKFYFKLADYEYNYLKKIFILTIMNKE